MVDTHWDADEYAPQDAGAGALPADNSSPQNGNFMNVVGAVLSLALLAGLVVWGYKLAVRDVSGVPVVRAVEGPMRIQPNDPGGESAAYQGFSVNNVQAEGGAAAPADTLALAPRNIGLVTGDTPASPSEQVSALVTPVVTAPENAAPAATDMTSLVDQLTDGAVPLAEILTDVTPTSSGGAQATQDAVNSAVNSVVAQVVLAPEIIAVSVPGISHSPRPGQRPANFAQRAAAQAQAAAAAQVAAQAQAQAAAQAAAAATPANGDAIAVVAPMPAQLVTEVDAASLAVGTRLVQLGAFDSAEIARAEWDRLAIKFEDYLPGKTRVVQEAVSGGKTFWRLRALGFDDLSDARRFCAVLMAGRAACIPVSTR